MKRILTMFVFIILIQSANAELIDNLQLYAPFDGNADDMSGNGNNGIVYGAVLTEDGNGNPNSAYQFNGTDSYIDFGTSDLGLTGSSEITFCAWIKPDRPTTYYSQVLSSEQFYRPYMIRTCGLSSAVTAQCLVRTEDGGAYVGADAGGIIVGNWYHILCRYDGTSVSIYVDGELQNSVSLSGLLKVSSQHILAGANPANPPKSFFHGAINDIRIWNRALNEDEIIEVYSGAPAPCIDNDGDGWYSDGIYNLYGLADCDDNNPFLFPLNTNNYCDCDDSDGFGQGTVEICGNGIDEDCDGFDLPCTGDIYVGGNEVNHDLDSITDECLDLIKTKRILFGSRSIGLATIAGLRSLADNPKYALNIEQYRIDGGDIIPDNAFDGPKMVQFVFSLYPMEERWNYFNNYIRSHSNKIDVAFEYLYASGTTEVYSMYDGYSSVLNSLAEDFPYIKFAIATHPVDTVTSPETSFNIGGKAYSEMVIGDYSGILPIFDVRDIESTKSDGSICQFEYDGTIYRNLCQEYNMNGDTLHPNTKEAEERLGKGIFILLSKMFCEPQLKGCTEDSECDDHLACNGLETCENNICVPGTPVDCSTYDIPPVETCNNNPDNNPLTWDYGEAFTSQCIEPGICTTKDQEITSTCSVLQCGAQCDADNPCPSTDCDGFDGCVGDDYYDYHDVENNCLDDCSCEANPCELLTIYPNDERCTGHQVDENLKLYIPFDGNADDMSGNGNNGIVYGAALTEDGYGNPNSAYQFNGTDSYIDFGTSDLGLTGSSEITFCAWIKPDRPTTYYS